VPATGAMLGATGLLLYRGLEAADE